MSLCSLDRSGESMNANELADNLMAIYEMDGASINVKEAAIMLRQQQAEIEALKADKEHLIENYENLMADFKIETYWKDGK